MSPIELNELMSPIEFMHVQYSPCEPNRVRMSRQKKKILNVSFAIESM